MHVRALIKPASAMKSAHFVTICRKIYNIWAA
jgi:hypothetical protein